MDLGSFTTLEQIMIRLRGVDGCPWDREQTHASLKPNLLEECYEVLDALDEEDSQKLCEELGDLLLQIMLHTQIATEAGEFNLWDVLRSINTKLIHRHPHIFGDAKVKDAREVAAKWHALKQEGRASGASLLSSIPREMPALAYSQTMQQRVAHAGFDWQDVAGVVEKLTEEIEELGKASDHQEKVREFGDLLLTLVNVARKLDLNAEDALRMANQRFRCRFLYMEEVCWRRGVPFSSLSLEEQNMLWEEAKQALSTDVSELEPPQT